MLGRIYFLILYQPLLNALILIYDFLPVHDLGISIIILTIIIRIIFYPLTLKTLKSQKKLSELQVKMREIQNRFKDDKEKQTEEIVGLYKKEKINPLGWFWGVIIQVPILFTLYQVFLKSLEQTEMTNLYRFVPKPSSINLSFLGYINLSNPNIWLAALAGVLQYLQFKMENRPLPNKDTTTQLSNVFQKQMTYFFSIFAFFILLKLPAAIALYWVTTTSLLIFQQLLFFKKYAQ